MSNLTPEQLDAIATEVTNRLINHFNGQVLTLNPLEIKTAPTNADQQDDTNWYCEQVFTLFNGKNHAEVAEQLGGSTQDVYKAIEYYRHQQDYVINQLVNAIGAGKPMIQEEARELLLSAEPMLYQHTLTQLRHKLSILNLCNSHGRGKRHD